jgi:hypothetical protein
MLTQHLREYHGSGRKPTRPLLMAPQADHTPAGQLRMAPQYRTHVDASFRDGATLHATHRHVIYRRRRSAGVTVTSLADGAGVRPHDHCRWRHIPGQTPTRLLQMAAQYRAKTDTSFIAAIKATHRHVPCSWRRSPGHKPTHPLQKELQFKKRVDKFLIAGTAVQSTRRQVQCRWCTTLGHTSTRSFQKALQSR